MLKTHIATQIYAKICFNTTSGQKKIIESLSEYLSESDPAAIFVLNGYAGTGKTTLIAALVGALKDCGIKPVLLAPTGRAAKVLSRYSGEPALTIHKRIYRQRTNADYESKFSLNINQERGAVFIVDEASMLANGSSDGAIFGSGALLDDLVSYVRGGKGCPTPRRSIRKLCPSMGRWFTRRWMKWCARRPNRVFCSTPPWYAACWRTASAKYRDSGWISLISRW